jgi:hypothetical protein
MIAAQNGITCWYLFTILMKYLFSVRQCDRYIVQNFNQSRNHTHGKCVISGLRREVDNICVLLENYVVGSGKKLPLIAA